MGNRRSFRPTAGEALEERMVLSHGAAATAGIHAAAAHAMAVARPPVPFVGPVGTLGDSYTDEYQFYPPNRSTARNWVEILHATRGVSFGPFTTQSRGEPRNQGFAYNWAESAATSTDMVTKQLPGLTAQVAAGKVQYVSVLIGANDFLDLLFNVQSGQVPAAEALPALFQTTATVEQNFATAVGTLLAASPDVKLVVSNLPNISAIPAARLAAASNPLAGLFLQATGLAIQQYTNEIDAIAASNPRVALLDLAGVTAQVTASPVGVLPFGGQVINLLTPGNDYHDFFLADAYHIGTVAQGIIADEFALAIDEKFGAQLFPPTPQEIVRYAAQIQRHAERVQAHTRPTA